VAVGLAVPGEGNALTGGGGVVPRKGSDRVGSCEQEGRRHNDLLAEIQGYLSCVLFSCCAVYLGEAWNRTQRLAWLRCTGKSPR
jgi:hypothetical protein